MSSSWGLITFAGSVVLYGIASALYYFEVARGRRDDDTRPIAPWLLAAAGALHSAYVVIASFVARVCPVHSVHFILSIASLISTAVYLVARTRFKIHALGLVVAPLGLVVILGTFFLGSASSEERLPASFIGLHVFANLVGAALFLLASAAAVMYLIQEKRLKNKKAVLLEKNSGLPPLDSLDKATHRFLMAGFPLLTLGVLTGTVWSEHLETGSLDEILRAVLGYATWLLIAGVLLLRVLAGWRGRRAAYGTVAGFLCAFAVLLVYLFRPMLKAAAMVGG
jgi:ABC-type uncharacterized transport system permease subunit